MWQWGQSRCIECGNGLGWGRCRAGDHRGGLRGMGTGGAMHEACMGSTVRQLAVRAFGYSLLQRRAWW